MTMGDPGMMGGMGWAGLVTVLLLSPVTRANESASWEPHRLIEFEDEDGPAELGPGPVRLALEGRGNGTRVSFKISGPEGTVFERRDTYGFLHRLDLPAGRYRLEGKGAGYAFITPEDSDLRLMEGGRLEHRFERNFGLLLFEELEAPSCLAVTTDTDLNLRIIELAAERFENHAIEADHRNVIPLGPIDSYKHAAFAHAGPGVARLEVELLRHCDETAGSLPRATPAPAGLTAGLAILLGMMGRSRRRRVTVP